MLRVKRGQEKLLKESDKRKFRSRVKDAFSWITEEQLDMLVPPGKSTILALHKLEAPNHTEELWCTGTDRQPIFFTYGRDFLPTVYTLQLAPQIVQSVLVHNGLAPKMYGGADLFFPGVIIPKELDTQSADWPEQLFFFEVRRNALCAIVEEGSWAPFAIGRLAMTKQEMVEGGLKGTAVAVLHHDRDEIWQAGSKQAAGVEPPVHVQQAFADLYQALNNKEAAAEAAKHEAELEERRRGFEEHKSSLAKGIRKYEKLLREMDELGAREAELDAAQRNKLARRDTIEEQLKAAREELSLMEERGFVDECHEVEAAAPEGSEADGAADHQSIPPEPDSASIEQAGALESPGATDAPEERVPADSSQSVDECNATEEAAAAEAAEVEMSVDDEFVAAVLFELSTESKPPVLASVLLGRAAAHTRGGLKSTSWKKGAKFLQAMDGVLALKTNGPGVVEVTGFEISNLSSDIRERIKSLKQSKREDQQSKAQGSSLGATKRGSQVVVTMRKVCNKNVTFVDYLEGWGYDEARMRGLAKEWRKRFSVSSSVTERHGTEGSATQFWSVQLQGKYVEQVAKSLRELGVSNVHVVAKAGAVTKKDKAANV